MHQLEQRPGMLAIVIIYLVGLAVLGAYMFNKQKKLEMSGNGTKEFFLAGGSLGKLVALGTMLATYTGNGTVAGGGNSLTYNYGIWTGICFSIPPLLAFTFLALIAPKIRQTGAVTCAQLLEKKFGSGARLFGGIVLMLSMISIVSYQFKGLANILYATVGVPVWAGNIIGAVLITFLAFGGGLRTVAATDAMSAFLMVIGLLIGLPFLFNAVGGFGAMVDIAKETHPGELTFFGTTGSFWVWLGGYVPLFFLTIGDQNYYQRINSAKDLKTARFSLFGTGIAALCINTIVAFYAFTAKQWFGENIIASQALISTATLMPTVLGGIVLAAAGAFAVTTGDSYLLSGASNFTLDIYKHKINPNANEEQQMKVTRIFILCAGVFAFGILQLFPDVLAVQYWAYTISAAGMTPAILGALLWKKSTKWGGIISMAIGTLITISWEWQLQKATGIQTIFVALPAALIALIVVSLATQKSNKAVA